MSVVTHDHVHRQPRHIVVRLLAVFRRVLFRYLLAYDHRQHIRQRHYAPALDHPIQHIDDILRLNAPDNASVAIFGGHHGLVFIALLHELHYLFIYIDKGLIPAAVAHIVCVVIQREHGADKLRIRRAVDLKPAHAVARSVVYALCAFKICVPVPLLAGLLLDKFYGCLYVVCSVALNILLRMTHGRNELEGRYAVLTLKALCDKAVSHERAVAGSVDLHGALAEHGEVIVDRNAKLRLRHGAHVARDAELLGNIKIVHARMLIEQVCREHRRHLAQDAV